MNSNNNHIFSFTWNKKTSLKTLSIWLLTIIIIESLFFTYSDSIFWYMLAFFVAMALLPPFFMWPLKLVLTPENIIIVRRFGKTTIPIGTITKMKYNKSSVAGSTMGDFIGIPLGWDKVSLSRIYYTTGHKNHLWLHTPYGDYYIGCDDCKRLAALIKEYNSDLREYL